MQFIIYINSVFYIGDREYIVMIAYTHTHTHSPVARETGVQSLVEAYQRLKKWHFMLLCLTLSNYKVRIKGKVEQSRESSRALPYTSM